MKFVSETDVDIATFNFDCTESTDAVSKLDFDWQEGTSQGNSLTSEEVVTLGKGEVFILYWKVYSCQSFLSLQWIVTKRRFGSLFRIFQVFSKTRSSAFTNHVTDKTIEFTHAKRSMTSPMRKYTFFLQTSDRHSWFDTQPIQHGKVITMHTAFIP